MTINFTEIWNYLTKNTSSTIITILIFLVVLYFVFKYGKSFIDGLVSLIKLMKRPQSKKEITIQDLEKHYLFTHINYLKTIKINCLNFGDEGRNYLIRLLLQHKLNHIEKATKEFIHIPNLNNLDAKDFEIELVNLMQSSLTKYLDEFKQEAHTQEEKEVAQIVIDAVWKNYNEQSEFTLNGFKDVINSPIYENNLVRIHSLLLPLMVSIEAFLINAEKSLNKLNGKLSNKTFHGYKFK